MKKIFVFLMMSVFALTMSAQKTNAKKAVVKEPDPNFYIFLQ